MKNTKIVVSKNKVVQKPPESSPEILIAQAIEKGLTVDTIERLVALKERMDAAAAMRAYRKAMADFQAECPIIKKANPVKNKDKTLRYKHEAMEDLVEVAAPIMQKHGLSRSFDTTWKDGNLVVICTASHIDGHSESGEFGVPLDKDAYMNNQQMVAAASTFASRYAFRNKFGITVGGQDNDMSDTPPDARKIDMPKLLEMIEKSGAKSIMEFAAKLKKDSEKYTESEKTVLLEAMDKRMKGLPDGEPVK
ncbi:MAG: ERF family protein [Undibacterium sp.]